jgi:hypothetical protein
MPYLSGGTWLSMPPEAYTGPEPDTQDIIVAPHRAPQLAPIFRAHPDRIALYETENLLDPASHWVRLSTQLRLACPENRWLNYSAANARVFGDEVRPLQKIHKLPVRDNRVARPIDVLFVGSLNMARAKVLERLAAAGARVHVPAAPCFGKELARLENQSKLLLNVHYYTPGVFESFRVVPAAHRGTPVISETSVGGEGSDWAPCYPYADLVEATLSALKGMNRGS